MKEGVEVPHKILLKKTLPDILAQKKVEEISDKEAYLEECLKKLVTDASEDQRLTFIGKITQILFHNSIDELILIIKILFGNILKKDRKRKLEYYINQDLDDPAQKNLIMLLTEQITTVRGSLDKSKILIGTNHGTIVVLSNEDFSVIETI